MHMCVCTYTESILKHRNTRYLGGRSLAFPLSAWPSLAPGHFVHLLPRGGFSHLEEGSAVSRALVSLLTPASSVERMRTPASSGMFAKESVLFTSLGTFVLRLTGRKEKKENWFLELEGCSENRKRWEMKRGNNERNFGSGPMVVLGPTAWPSGQGLAQSPPHSPAVQTIRDFLTIAQSEDFCQEDFCSDKTFMGRLDINQLETWFTD